MAKAEKYDAIYPRVSSDKQDHRSQLPDLERWAETQGENVRWYTETASGKTMARPKWDRLEKDLRAGKIRRIVVWRLDRLGRTVSGLSSLFKELQERKVGLVSLREGLDLNTPAGRLMAHVIASVAEYETELRAERVQAGQAVAKANGKTWGGSKKGWRRKANEEKAVQVKKMKKDGASVAEIGRVVGLSRPTVYSILGEETSK